MVVLISPIVGAEGAQAGHRPGTHMDVFELRRRLVEDYERYIRSFISIRDELIRDEVDRSLTGGMLWPEPRIGLNPSFESGGRIDDLVDDGRLHPECSKIFRIKPDDGPERALTLHRHQVDAIDAARTGSNYVLTTGTGSGKSLAYIVPVVDHVLRNGSRRGIKAIIVYPMNALANSQFGELEKFLTRGYSAGGEPVTFRRYTGQESDDDRAEIIANPPDILLTNYVMLELILTRVDERPLVRAAEGLRFLVFDELHTYRGRQGADVALLARRVREACKGHELQVIGTSATMATSGTFAEQQEAVARVASLLFGSAVAPSHVIGETLRRSTPAFDPDDSTLVDELRTQLRTRAAPAADFRTFANEPLSRWVETTFGVSEEPESGRLVRVTPRSISGDLGAATELARLVGVDQEDCARAIEQQLLAGNVVAQDNGFPVFAFRLHQFISRGTTVFASIEAEHERYLTLNPQTFVPEHRDKILVPLVFCRECGQEYYSIILPEGHDSAIEPKPIDFRDEIRGEPGLLYLSSNEPWPDDIGSIVDRVPETWIEEGPGGALRVKRDQRKRLPEPVTVSTLGELNVSGQRAWLIRGQFQFCLACGVAYGSRQRSEALKLSTLGAGGRSTATTILSLAAVRYLRHDKALSREARKLLSFTDNRQDASLQAGHFNDFVETGLLRSALYRAVDAVGSAGLDHDELTQHVFDSLALPKALYAFNPELRGRAADETDKALREVLGYRLYLDQRRGWRITSPNLEQTGLIRVEYPSLMAAAADDDLWRSGHGALATATAAERHRVGHALLDHLRRELAIKVDYLNAQSLERIRIAKRLAAVRTGDDEPSPDAVRSALRDVVSHCLHGIDLNPMAVELCKVSLWVEAMVPGRPLGFLDHRIIRGNALLGATPELLANGVPDDAFKPLTGDDKQVVSSLKKRNKESRTGQGNLFAGGVDSITVGLTKLATEVASLDEDSVRGVEAKAKRWTELVDSNEYRAAVHAADTWCAAFVAAKTADSVEITHDTYRHAVDRPDSVDPMVRSGVDALADEYGLLHWHLAFLDAYTDEDGSGFDVVLGNPPWEKVKLSEKEFFAARGPQIADLAGAKRKAAIAKLEFEDPELWDEFQTALRHADGESHLLRSSGRFPLCGRGDVNTYAVFAEAMRDGISPTGRLGVIVPTGIATDDTTKHFFASCVDTRRLVSLLDFQNVDLFPGVGHGVMHFALLTLSGRKGPTEAAEFAFSLKRVGDLDDAERRFSLSPDDLALINPNTRTAPVFRTRRDAEITKKIYRNVPVLVRDGDPDGNPWGIEFSTMFHMTNDSPLFRTADELRAVGGTLDGNVWTLGGQRWLPLYKAKMVHHFNHRFGDYAMKPEGNQGHSLPDIPLSDLQDPTYVVQARYWVAEAEVRAAMRDPGARWFLGFRDICRSTDERTLIASVVPVSAVGNKFPLLNPGHPSRHLLAACLSSYVADYVARQKLGGTSMNYFVFRQLAVIDPQVLDELTPWSGAPLTSWLEHRAVELTYTSHDLAGFAADLGYTGRPFRWNSERREMIRAELDGAFFHLYGLERDEVDYVMDTFPVVRRRDEAKHGEYRTKRLILGRYDALAAAIATNTEYRTVLDPPGDRRVTHA